MLLAFACSPMTMRKRSAMPDEKNLVLLIRLLRNCIAWIPKAISTEATKEKFCVVLDKYDEYRKAVEAIHKMS